MHDIFKAADAKARSRFTYKFDDGDTWRSHADEVLAGKPWKGDCDDLASTSADLAIRMGASKGELWFAVVSSKRNGRGDHMIAIGRDEYGVFWVLGDTFGPMYKLSRMQHELIHVHNLNWNIREWHHMTRDEFLARH